MRSVLNYGKMQVISGDFGEEGFLEIVSENAAALSDARSCRLVVKYSKERNLGGDK